MSYETEESKDVARIVCIVFIIIILVILYFLFGHPYYRIWASKMESRAENVRLEELGKCNAK